ncbi:hypothetical protein EVAR_22489_1 [Eumeta japonica]|uniref:Uncharacterized protein n=1 Tax=Eumeta variegata TaxID=151549 RepID=A0A4C1VDK9_EUMVA|nr:hypothetical protein EVAR_22489_1 [Eumeta japonica]
MCVPVTAAEPAPSRIRQRSHPRCGSDSAAAPALIQSFVTDCTRGWAVRFGPSTKTLIGACVLAPRTVLSMSYRTACGDLTHSHCHWGRCSGPSLKPLMYIRL